MARWDKPSESSIPDWFWQAVDTEPETRSVEVDECDVFYRFYPSAGKPGLLLIHGMNAHSRWWDFIAPQLLDHYEVAAMDLTGMGDSDYRYEYSADTFADEIAAVLDHAGFGPDCTVVAHSFGGYMAVHAANRHAGRFEHLVLVDSGIRHPDDAMPDRPRMGGDRAKVYPDRESALMRFRLYPPQPCANEFITQYIARHSLMAEDGGGWSWKFDEDLFVSIEGSERNADDYRNLNLKLGVIYGEDSELFSSRTLEYMREIIPVDFPAVGIADAQHHLFLDQPLKFVEVVKEMVAQLRGG